MDDILGHICTKWASDSHSRRNYSSHFMLRGELKDICGRDELVVLLVNVCETNSHG